MKPATAAPIVKPFDTTSIAVTRERFGLYSPTRATALGMIAPRPSPAMMRMISDLSVLLTRSPLPDAIPPKTRARRERVVAVDHLHGFAKSFFRRLEPELARLRPPFG